VRSPSFNIPQEIDDLRETYGELLLKKGGKRGSMVSAATASIASLLREAVGYALVRRTSARPSTRGVDSRHAYFVG